MSWRTFCDKYDCEPHQVRRMLYLVVLNGVPHFLGTERRLWRHRDYRMYYCGLWCFLTNQRLCHKLERSGRQQIRDYIDARASAEEDDEW